LGRPPYLLQQLLLLLTYLSQPDAEAETFARCSCRQRQPSSGEQLLNQPPQVMVKMVISQLT